MHIIWFAQTFTLTLRHRHYWLKSDSASTWLFVTLCLNMKLTSQLLCSHSASHGVQRVGAVQWHQSHIDNIHYILFKIHCYSYSYLKKHSVLKPLHILMFSTGWTLTCLLFTVHIFLSVPEQVMISVHKQNCCSCNHDISRISWSADTKKCIMLHWFTGGLVLQEHFINTLLQINTGLRPLLNSQSNSIKVTYFTSAHRMAVLPTDPATWAQWCQTFIALSPTEESSCTQPMRRAPRGR